MQYNLGMRIHEYLVVDFQAFIGLVDTIDGITVTINYTIDDPREDRLLSIHTKPIWMRELINYFAHDPQVRLKIILSISTTFL